MTQDPRPGASSGAVQHIPQFFVRQKITVVTNRYEIRAPGPDGQEGPVIAVAQQKRMAFKEHVTFYSDEARTQPVFSFKARQGLDVRAEHDVFDAGGQPLGWFKKEFGTSLVRSTWQLRYGAPAEVSARGQERRPGIAILRRAWDFIPVLGDVWVPFVFHFDFVDQATGEAVLVSERRKAIRDRYTITVPDTRLDFRVAASMAVALDALQSR